MDIKECEEKGFIRITRINTSLVRSLIEMSELKEDTIKRAELDEKNISAYVPMAYDSLREVLEAFCVLYGYKVTSHECLGKLMKELLINFDYFSFDRFRYIRNGINYYGKKVGFEEGKEIIAKILKLKKDILKDVKKELDKK